VRRPTFTQGTPAAWYSDAPTVVRVKRRTERYVKAMLTEWFLEQLEAYFPERYGDLIKSYEAGWYRELSNDSMGIISDLEYAPYVEAMGPGTNWTKKGTKPAAAWQTYNLLVSRFPQAMQQAFQQAVAMEAGRFTRY